MILDRWRGKPCVARLYADYTSASITKYQSDNYVCSCLRSYRCLCLFEDGAGDIFLAATVYAAGLIIFVGASTLAQ
jgi:hypothetical protein